MKGIEEMAGKAVVCLVGMLVLMMILIIGIQVGKHTERQRLVELGLYPTSNEIVNSENDIYGGINGN